MLVGFLRHGGSQKGILQQQTGSRVLKGHVKRFRSDLILQILDARSQVLEEGLGVLLRLLLHRLLMMARTVVVTIEFPRSL